MNKPSPPLRGIIPPILTPLRHGRPDLPSLRRLLDRTHAAGCPALCIGGTVGLGTLLTDEDWQSVVEAAAEWADHRIPLLAGIMETSTPRAIQRIRLVTNLGYHGYLLAPTYYVTLRTFTEFYRHFAECRATSDIEMLLYNVPTCTGSPIPRDVVESCFREEMCRGIKDSSGDLDSFAGMCRIANDCGGSAFMGGMPDLAWLREVGGAGLVPVPANLEPEIFVSAWQAVERDDTSAMARIQKDITRLWTTLVTPDDWMRGTIYAIGLQGLGDGELIPPLDALDPKRRSAIEALVGGLAN